MEYLDRKTDVQRGENGIINKNSIRKGVTNMDEKQTKVSEKSNETSDEIGMVRLMLDNHIGGLEIHKALADDTCCCTEDDERTLQLMYRIRDILARIQPVQSEE